MLTLPMLLGAFQPPGLVRVSPGPKITNSLASCYVRRSPDDLDLQLIAFMELNRVCKIHPGLLLVLLHARG